MRMLAFALLVIFGLGLLPAPMHSQQKGGEEETGPYDVAAKWPAPFARSGYVQGSQGGVFAETPGQPGRAEAPREAAQQFQRRVGFPWSSGDRRQAGTAKLHHRR